MDVRDRRYRAAEDAAEWILRLQSGDLNRAERTRYVEWLRESPVHVGEMLRITRLHAQLSDFSGWKDIPSVDERELSDSVVGITPGRSAAARAPIWRTRGPSRLAAALAAGLSALALTFGYLAYERSRSVETGAAERREVTLPDGSVAQLSPWTTLRLAYGSVSRGVVLSRGDAFFRVVKDPTRPFVVQTDHTRVRAVGTAFGVEHAGDSVIVTVEEGRVAVLHATTDAAPAATPSEVTEVSLGANQQIVVPRAGPIGAVRHVDSRRELAWVDGRLLFDHDSMAEVVQRFNRYNQIQIQITDKKLSERRVTAVFNASDPEALILFLESEANVRITRPSSNLVVIDSEGPN